MSVPRRIISDLMYFAAATPTVAVKRRLRLGAVVIARGQHAGRPPWPAIFAKAFATVADEMPELRRAYVTLPWPHLYEYPQSVAIIAVERAHEGEQGVFGCVVKDPLSLPINEIGRQLTHAASAPFKEIGRFRRIGRLAKLPLLIRRTLMWVALSSGRQRARHFGTFAISTVASFGAELLTPLSVWTVLLHYGVLSDDGSLDVRLTFDHRAVDGATAARALARLEAVLHGPIL
ncbi:MAG: hypothetical protein HQ485_02755, partial [Acidobacteria bacterium]|nr:hypothetical protein [Acidobacteriota bacterium]